jgi:serine/threonine protein kinase
LTAFTIHSACILVMPYVGAPLSATPEFVLPISYRCIAYFVLFLLPTFSEQVWDREAVLAALVEIHDADILHRDLSLNNILVSDSGLTIVDFSHSRVSFDQDAKKSECSLLWSLLNRREARYRRFSAKGI